MEWVGRLYVGVADLVPHMLGGNNVMMVFHLGFGWCSSTVASNNRNFDWVVLSLGRYSSAVVSMANMENIDWVALEGLFCTGLVQQVLLITLL
jgi:hypothetical protein